ncbi:MAG TPA: sensor histidine kinase [Cyclobacteriaceae bacterium]
MVLNSRAIALLISTCIGVITSLFLSLLESATNTEIAVTFFLTFGSGYILTRLVLEFLFFKHINEIYEALEEVKRDSFSFGSKKGTWYNSINPLRIINREIFSYAQDKQKEIDELKQMENFRREFIADVSHELKTPIFAAQGFVHTLLDGAIEDKKVRTKFLKKAAKSLDGLDIIVQDLLTISQMETGEIKMHFEYFDLYDLCREVFDQLEGKADKKGIELRISNNQNKQIFVYADYQRLYQVMLNLISNAIKYTKKGGFAEVDFKPDGDLVKILVKDNGRGIPEKDIKRIFERFYRVEKSRSKEKGGTGLGLAIVKHIIEAHDSKVEVESKVDEGSTFSFYLKSKNPSTANNKKELVRENSE